MSVRVWAGVYRERGWAGRLAFARLGRSGRVADWAGWVEAQWGKRGFFPPFLFLFAIFAFFQFPFILALVNYQSGT